MWLSMDFMFDRLMSGRPFRTLNILDDYNREALNITIDTSISSQRTARELEQLIEYRGKPRMIPCRQRSRVPGTSGMV
jgi:putative transposase